MKVPPRHVCHWPGCETQIPAANWACFPHWRQLPNSYRARLLSLFNTGSPLPGYVEAVAETEAWIRKEILRVRGWEYDL